MNIQTKYETWKKKLLYKNEMRWKCKYVCGVNIADFPYNIDICTLEIIENYWKKESWWWQPKLIKI